jgi:hypothetical protein
VAIQYLVLLLQSVVVKAVDITVTRLDLADRRVVKHMAVDEVLQHQVKEMLVALVELQHHKTLVVVVVKAEQLLPLMVLIIQLLVQVVSGKHIVSQGQV